MIGDIIKAAYTDNENLYYLVIEVHERRKEYVAIHLPSNRECPIGFRSAHEEYKRVNNT
jgi:hypothetical protein